MNRIHERSQCTILQHIDDIKLSHALDEVLNNKIEQIKKEFVSKLSGMTFIMILFAAVIFLGTILNSSLIAISERQREIATFRVMGYNFNEISLPFFYENLIINMIGALIGLPLGYIMLYGMSLMYQNNLFSMPCIVNTGSWFLCLILVFLFVLISQFVIYRTIIKIDWIESLQIKE